MIFILVVPHVLVCSYSDMHTGSATCISVWVYSINWMNIKLNAKKKSKSFINLVIGSVPVSHVSKHVFQTALEDL